MSDEYSLYDAKANFSRIVKRVREGGGSVVVTVHGEPAVEIRAYKPLPVEHEARWAEMVARGIIRPGRGSPRDIVWNPGGPRRRGGLRRFLEERWSDD